MKKGMLIDIYSYFDRWAANYIVYHGQHLEEYGDVGAAMSHFSSLYEHQASMLEQGNIEGTIQSGLKGKGATAAEVFKMVGELADGSFTNQTMNEIANWMNNNMDVAAQQVNFDNYMAIISLAGEFSGALAQVGNTAQINEFFELLLVALNDAKLLSIEMLDILADIGKHLAGTSFAIDQSWKNKVVTLEESDIALAQKVLDSLTRVVDKMRSTGAVNARSFAGTIRNIFTNVIGTKIQQLMVAEALGVDAAEAFNNEMARWAQGLSRSGKFTYTKMPSAKSYSSFNKNIFNNGVFSMNVMKSGKQITVEVGTNIDVASLNSRKRPAVNINIVGNGTLGEYANWDGEEKYLAYNMLAHGNEFVEASNKVRASVAASFFNQWLSSGKLTQGKLQLLVVRGKFIPVGRIINNICNEIAEIGSDDAFRMGNAENAWIGGRANLANALTRSKIVNALINKLTIAATINDNILLRYAY